jgi:hypothetical protein
MFEFYRDCTFANSGSWITPIAQSISAIAALLAFYIAVRNLGGTKNTQKLQAQMNLISLENEVIKNLIIYKKALSDYSTPIKGVNMSEIYERKINAFELYISSADKLAALINAEYLKKQFPKRNWENEYKKTFVKVVEYHKDEDSTNPNEDDMIQNINSLLESWSKSTINKKLVEIIMGFFCKNQHNEEV